MNKKLFRCFVVLQTKNTTKKSAGIKPKRKDPTDSSWVGHPVPFCSYLMHKQGRGRPFSTSLENNIWETGKCSSHYIAQCIALNYTLYFTVHCTVFYTILHSALYCRFSMAAPQHLSARESREAAQIERNQIFSLFAGSIQQLKAPAIARYSLSRLTGAILL